MDEEVKDVVEESNKRERSLNILFLGDVHCGKSTVVRAVMPVNDLINRRRINGSVQSTIRSNIERTHLFYLGDSDYIDEEGLIATKKENLELVIHDHPAIKKYRPLDDIISKLPILDVIVFILLPVKTEFQASFKDVECILECLRIAQMFETPNLIVAVNEMGSEEIDWNKNYYEGAKSFFDQSLPNNKFTLINNCMWIPISGLTRCNIDRPIKPEVCNWYEGPTLMELFESINLPEEDEQESLRMLVLYTESKTNLNVCVKIHSGRIKNKETIMVMPYKITAQIKSIYSINNQSLESAKAGNVVILGFKEVLTTDYIHKGCILCDTIDQCPTFRTFLADVKFISESNVVPFFFAGGNWKMHLHTMEEECVVKRILKVRKTKDGEIKNTKFARRGEYIRCIISTKRIIAAEKYSVMKRLGKFILRNMDSTAAEGIIFKYKPILEGVQ